jgi:hypothetical protein
VLLLAAAAMADGEPAGVVAPGRPRSGLYGSRVVISSKVERVICRRPGEVGL